MASHLTLRQVLPRYKHLCHAPNPKGFKACKTKPSRENVGDFFFLPYDKINKPIDLSTI